jgi:hypothetical protein
VSAVLAGFALAIFLSGLFGRRRTELIERASFALAAGIALADDAVETEPAEKVRTKGRKRIKNMI